MTLSSESMNLKDLIQSSHSYESWNEDYEWIFGTSFTKRGKSSYLQKLGNFALNYLKLSLPYLNLWKLLKIDKSVN